jgi:hypothetical protein
MRQRLTGNGENQVGIVQDGGIFLSFCPGFHWFSRLQGMKKKLIPPVVWIYSLVKTSFLQQDVWCRISL